MIMERCTHRFERKQKGFKPTLILYFYSKFNICLNGTIFLKWFVFVFAFTAINHAVDDFFCTNRYNFNNCYLLRAVFPL